MKLQHQIINKAKNNRIIRTAVRLCKDSKTAKELRRSVKEATCLTTKQFEERQKFRYKPTFVKSSDAAYNLVNSISIKTYLEVIQNNDGAQLREPAQGSLIKTRQRMLATAYNLIGDCSSLSLCDLGGSNGFYAIMAHDFGFKPIHVVDPRPEHQAEHAFLKSIFSKQFVSEFRLGTLETADLLPAYDVMLVQGLLYHLYDHSSFLRKLKSITNKALLLDTELSGSTALGAVAKVEDTSHLRMGTGGVALYPSEAAVYALLLNAGFQSLVRINPPEDLPDLHGYKRARRVMVLCQ